MTIHNVTFNVRIPLVGPIGSPPRTESRVLAVPEMPPELPMRNTAAHILKDKG